MAKRQAKNPTGKRPGARNQKIIFDSAKGFARVGDYWADKVYEVASKEAERLVSVKGARYATKKDGVVEELPEPEDIPSGVDASSATAGANDDPPAGDAGDEE